MDLVVWSQICCRWFGNIPCLFKYSCARGHVFLLWTVCNGTSLPEVFMVEKTFDILAACPVCSCHYPHRPDLLHGGLQLSVPSFPVHHHELRVHLPAALSPLLVPCLHQGSEVAQNYRKRELQKQAPLKHTRGLDLQWRLGYLAFLDNQDTLACAVHFVYFSKPRACIFMISYLGFWSLRVQSSQVSLLSGKAWNSQEVSCCLSNQSEVLIHLATSRGGYEVI